jgi:protein gp37
MSKTSISWATHSWNPLSGCSPCSAGCSSCYAQVMANRLRGRHGYDAVEPFKPTFHRNRLADPLHWRSGARIFTVSMGDLFHEQVPFEWVDEVFKIICECHGRHVFLILTKRPQRMLDWFEHARREHVGWFSPSTGLLDLWQTWFGVSVENQANESRLNYLMMAPTDRIFVSCEPLLGPLMCPKSPGGWESSG